MLNLNLNLTRSVKAILIANVVAFFLSCIMPNFIYGLFALYAPSTDLFMIPQLVTHQFLHAGFLHIIFNMLALISFGPDMERYYGTKRFTIIYLLAGIFAGTVQMYNVSGNQPLVGASGALFAIFAMFALRNPNTKSIFLFIPYPIKTIYLFYIFCGIELLATIFNFQEGVGHLAHLGGALFGFLVHHTYSEKNNRY